MKPQLEFGQNAKQLSQLSASRARAEDIQLCPVAGSDRAAIARLLLDPEQEQFAGSVDPIFDELQDSLHPDLEHPFAIVVRDETVGFFILREKKAVPAWAPQDVVTLHSFRIGRARQGRGYGRAGTALAAAWVRQNRPDVTQLMLAVNTRNLVAKAVYLNCGFIDTGATYRGPIGQQNILSYIISRNSG
ncbi:GNAT family N-acetyltransferase [Mesorhizobium sp. WSM2239]|uniref:GNAT family N-acetyltransferase n=2 Tax=unclassified Mesorhizobium TaxID=325217 RepID=A0AAU8DIV0_9HYPH